MGEQGAVLEHHSDSPPFWRDECLIVTQDPVAEEDRSGPLAFQPGDGPQESGLAAAAGPEERYHLTGRHLERDVVEDRWPVIGHREVGHREALGYGPGDSRPLVQHA